MLHYTSWGSIIQVCDDCHKAKTIEQVGLCPKHEKESSEFRKELQTSGCQAFTMFSVLNYNLEISK